MAKRTRQPRTLYVTRDGAEDEVDIWLGKPKAHTTNCESCGEQYRGWQVTRGARILLDDVCDTGFRASGIVVPPGGIVKFKLLVEDD